MARNIGRHQRLIGHPPSQATIDRMLACAALLVVQASRPLRPPPTRFERLSIPASVLALRADRKAGLL